ncbi:MAG: cell wall anchor protein [Lachnospiraceae bacterium]|nr:cell wall anchor protein [Lachnospiraceae bacterium]
MKQKLKRFIAVIMAMVTAIMTVVSGSIPVVAASPQANLKIWPASPNRTGKIEEFEPGYDHGIMYYHMIDNEVSYCLNYTLEATNGSLLTSSYDMMSEFTTEQERLLHYCLYYGHSNTVMAEPTEVQKDERSATQAMVWIIEAGIFGTEKADSAARKICNAGYDPEYAYSYYEKLKENITNAYYMKRPSFTAANILNASTYELKWNESNQRFENTFTDTNGILSAYDLTLNGYSVSRNGNKITIYTDSVKTTSTLATLKNNTNAVEIAGSCIYWVTGNPEDQEMISTKPAADPVTAYFRLKTESLGYGAVTKTDESTGKKLAGAVFGIYKDSGCTSLVETMITDSNGYAKSGYLTSGTYYVKEISAPEGYVVSNKVHTLTVRAGQTTNINATNSEQLGNITIYKEGEVLTGWDGSNFIYENDFLSGVTFKVTAGSDIYKADGTKVYDKGAVVEENLVTGSDGKAILTDLHLGTYVISETSSIDGYTINTTPQTVELTYGNQSEEVQYEAVNVINTRQKAEVKVYKVDSETKNSLVGGEYTLYAADDIQNHVGEVIVSKHTALQTVSTGENGMVCYTVDLPIANSYYIMETKAPEGYIRDTEAVYRFMFEYMAETEEKAVFSHAFSNDRTTAKIRIHKLDRELNEPVSQGNATLEGAVYGIYARDNIIHPDGVTGIVFSADELVATVITNDKGEASADNLYLGNYYIKEIQPSMGYLLDETEYDVVCGYEGDMVVEVSRSRNVYETVMKQSFQLIKIADNGIDTEATLLEAAGFKAYLKSSLSVNKEGSYDFDNANPIVIGENGETELFTDEKGHLTTIPIPYGDYVVVESTTPHNMVTIRPFEVSIAENSNEPQTWRVFVDREFTAKLRIVKKDADTGNVVLVPNAEFKIYNVDTKEYVEMITTYPSKEVHTSFFTDEDGDLILPDVLSVGTYRIEEVSAPYGYLLNENFVTVKIDSDTFHKVDYDINEAIITVMYEDTAVVGKLAVEKRGEVLTGYKMGQFVYEEQPLKGAKFNIYAAEDIYTPDGQKSENGERITLYQAGDLIDTVVTDDNGKAEVSNLPLGAYRVVEVEAPHGFVCGKDEKRVTLEYANQETAVVMETVTFVNDRQKLDISVIKKDAETGDTISGAVFGLYAKEDIKNINGEVIIEAGSLVEMVTSDEAGLIQFTRDYPFAKYYVKELKASKGYVSSNDIIEYDAEYQGQDVEVVTYRSEFSNHPVRVEISKTDITGQHELEGAKLSIIDENGNVIHSWVSDGSVHLIERLPVGKYILKEECAPYGYSLAEDVAFEVYETLEIQKVDMKDDFIKGQIVIRKTDEDTGKPISGVEFEILDQEGNVIEKLVTNEDGVGTSSLFDITFIDKDIFVKDNTFYVKEVKTANNYVLDDTVREVILDFENAIDGVVVYTLDITNKYVEPETPNTGDTFNILPVALLMGSATVVGVTAVKGRRKENERTE